MGACGGSNETLAAGFVLNATVEDVRSMAFRPFVRSLRLLGSCATSGGLFVDGGLRLRIQQETRVTVEAVLAPNRSSYSLRYAGTGAAIADTANSLFHGDQLAAPSASSCCILLKSLVLTANLVKKVTARLQISGNFSAVFSGGNNSASAVALKRSLEDQLSAKLGYRVTVVSLYQGSIIAVYVVAVPAANDSVSSEVVSTISDMSTNSSDILAAVESSCQDAGGCAGGVTFASSDVTDVSIESSGGQQQAAAAACGTGCIAGIVISVSLAAVSAVIIVYMLNKKGTSSKQDSDDPVTITESRSSTDFSPHGKQQTTTAYSSNPMAARAPRNSKSQPEELQVEDV
jgi:hypothetical protein